MDKSTIGMIAGILVMLSPIPYGIRVWQKKIFPNIITWFLWSIIGFALLVSYDSSGAKDNIWPAVFGFSNPVIIVVIALIRNRNFEKLGRWDYGCLVFGIISIAVWYYVRDSKGLAQYALYLGIIADAFASIPTLIFLWKEPWQDRPFAWSLYALGYGLAFFAISEITFANLILPVYMFVGASFITVPLYLYRIKNRISIREWI